jgi:hypothetical protein
VRLCEPSWEVRRCALLGVPYRVIWGSVWEEKTLIRSTNQKLAEYGLIRQPDHIAQYGGPLRRRCRRIVTTSFSGNVDTALSPKATF